MKTVEIIGYNRANLGKAETRQLRAESNVPCVLYGGKEQVHFYSPMILFRDVVYTPEARFVDLNIEGEHRRAILQDVQFHPVSETLLHADFLELFDNKPVKMKIPIRTVGKAPGVQQGGKLIMKLTHLSVKALPNDMPDFIDLDISSLALGKTVKVKAIEAKNFEILTSPLVSIASVEVPRAMRGKTTESEEEGKK
ncbi:MAG: 50S ribosomal protein L25/general stress protein Ctc [Cyclobacteriaceae bacterium]|nr:50S ribosomal protein L25/general stress protein Ctc [Cyclobacteriaceae bacterium]